VNEMTSGLLRIVHEDEDLLVLNKPAGLVCHPAKRGLESSLSGRVRLYLGLDQPVHLINRLDRETSGVVVAAKSIEAARRLRKIWASREVEKEYWAVVHGHVERDQLTLEGPLGADENSPVAVKDCVRADGAEARTEAEVIRRFEREEGAFTWLQVRPHTGRKHQIRIHLAHEGHPIVGDKLYGADEQAYLDLSGSTFFAEQWRPRLLLPYQALHAGSVTFAWGGGRFEACGEPEPWLMPFVDGAPLPALTELWDELESTSKPQLAIEPDATNPQ
jgi:23S rRNA pseudouridine1911/1915/1917 synthase